MKYNFLKFAIACGLLAPLLYSSEALINGFLQPGYSFTSDHISELAQFPYGWIQDLTFVIFGLLEVCFAIGLLLLILHRTLVGLAAFVFLTLFGLGAVGAGLFPEPIHGLGTHGIVSSVAFVAIIVAMLAVGLFLKQQHIGKRFEVYTFASCALAIISFLVWTVVIEPKQGLAIHDPLRVNSPFGHWIGVAQRVNVLIWLAWLFAAALVMRKYIPKTLKANLHVGGK